MATRNVIGILLLLTTPLAGAMPVEAIFDTGAPVSMSGIADVVARGAAWDLSGASELPDLSWTSAEGYEILRERRAYGTTELSVGEPSQQVSTKNRSLAFGAGRLRDLTCVDTCLALVFSADAASQIRTQGIVESDVRALDRVLELAPYQVSSDFRVWRFEKGTLVMRAPLTSAALEGTFGLVLWNVEGTLETDGGAEEFRTGTSYVSDEGPTGALGFAVRTSYVVLTLEDAGLAPSEGSADLLAPAMSVALDGALRSADATGFVRVGYERHELDDDPLEIDGTTDPSLEGTRSDLLGVEAPLRSGLAVSLRGEGRAVSIDGAPVSPALPALSQPTTLAIGGALLAVAGGIALYSRITRASLFENANRRQIYDLITRRPGLCATEIAREVELARVVVQHHLRVLARQRMVVERESAGSTLLFASERTPTGDQLAMHAMLRNSTRREIALRIARTPIGATQRQLAQDLGISQRLVSYHLSELAQAGLVTASPGKAQVYRPSPQLELVGSHGLAGSA